MGIIIELTRSVKADKYHLLMQLGRLSDQRHIIAFLKRANENKDKKISPANITNDLLRKLPESVGRRMIQRCVDLQVMEWVNEGKFGKLTKLGEDAINDDKVFQFERDLYEVTYTDDSLVPSLIDCIPLDELANSSNEIVIANTQNKNNQKNITIVSDRLKNKLYNHGKLYPIGKQKGPIIVKKIEKYGTKLPNTVNLKLQLTIEDTDNISFSVSGEYSENLNHPQLSFSKIYDEIILYQKQYCNHKFNKNILRIDFDDIDNEDQKYHFKKDITLRNVTLTDLGSFDQVKIINQPIMPNSEIDAQKWSEWLIEYNIKGFITPSDYVEHLSNIEARMKEYIPTFTLNKIDQKEIAKRIKEKNIGKLPKKYWFVKAPLDLTVGVSDHAN